MGFKAFCGSLGLSRSPWASLRIAGPLCASLGLSGRPWPEVSLGFRREMIGGIATENLTHFLNSLAIAGRMNLHVDVLRGDNDHHRAEAAFKATALALRAALSSTGSADIPSTKGVLG